MFTRGKKKKMRSFQLCLVCWNQANLPGRKDGTNKFGNPKLSDGVTEDNGAGLQFKSSLIPSFATVKVQESCRIPSHSEVDCLKNVCGG